LVSYARAVTDQTAAATQAPLRQKARDELLTVALEQFATVGFAGTSLQQIADLAGYSKSSVLYHFASKDALLEAAIGPAIDRLAELLRDLELVRRSPGSRAVFVDEFVGFLFAYRLEVHTFINQGQSLRGVPVIDRANMLLGKLVEMFEAQMATTEEKVRFGIALGGAAYLLVAGMTFGRGEDVPDEELKRALVNTVTDLLAPRATD
jgi:TetR/AcrR family transcriptional regulator